MKTRREEMHNVAWLTAMLTAIGTNDPKKFPTSPDELLKKNEPPTPFSKEQWKTVIRQLTGGNKEQPTRPKYPARE